MKPIDQTQFGYPNGNCFAACVASILELPLSECNIFPEGVDKETEHDIKTKRHWWSAFQEWLLENHNLWAVFIHIDELRGRKPKGWSIVSGPGPRGLDHSTVGLNGEIVHDPHPDKTELLKVRDYILFVPVK